MRVEVDDLGGFVAKHVFTYLSDDVELVRFATRNADLAVMILVLDPRIGAVDSHVERWGELESIAWASDDVGVTFNCMAETPRRFVREFAAFIMVSDDVDAASREFGPRANLGRQRPQREAKACPYTRRGETVARCDRRKR